MTRPINASLFITDFLATGNPGEYTIENAQFNNQADATNNGAGDVTVGFTLYVPALDLNQGTSIPGVFHRYRLTSVTPIDSATLSATIIWDEDGAEADAPSGNSYCMLSQVTPTHKFSLWPTDVLYPGLPGGMTNAALVLENRDRTEKIVSGGGGGGSSPIVVTGSTTDGTNLILSPSTPIATTPTSTVVFRAVVIGRRTDVPNQCVSLTIEGSAYVNEFSGQLVLHGNTLTNVISRYDPEWYATAVVNTAQNCIDIQVNGSANASLNWSATLSLTIL